MRRLKNFVSKSKGNAPEAMVSRELPTGPAVGEKAAQTVTTEETAPPERERSEVAKAKLKELWHDGVSKGKVELVKGKLKVEKSIDEALGLGPKPNAVPPGEPNIHGEHRKVEIGWHPVAGLAGKWFSEKTGIGRLITENINKYPDPTQHWAVLVGDYSHELWMDEKLDVIYINGKINREEWHTFEVGKTRFNDEALRQAGEMVIFNMRQKKAAYNLISNNCQNFAVTMLDTIQIGAHRQFATSFSVYQTATGSGSIKDLFAEKPLEDEEEGGPGDEPSQSHQNAVQHAQQVMDQHTTQLDTHTRR